MGGAQVREKVAILGGGIAALTTAFELTSQPDWRARFESITIYQLGWRLGGKCASSRGPHGRIEEHGIHGFLGSYFNALPMFAACYDELARPPDAPLATFETAFRHQSFGLLWERLGRTYSPWRQDSPENDRSPREPLPSTKRFELQMIGVAETLLTMIFLMPLPDGALRRWLAKRVRRAAINIGMRLAEPRDHKGVAFLHALWRGVFQGLLYHLTKPFTGLRRTFVMLDHLFTMVGGVFADDVQRQGYDRLDEENFTDWLTRHGARPTTVRSPFDFNYPNMTYQYPRGDTSKPPRMAAGAFVNWALLSSAYTGSFIWLFSAGTGEALIAPLYEVLARRGVRFEFFHRVQRLRLAADGKTVAAVDCRVQATLKDPAAGYRPLIDCKGLPSWPHAPLFDQLVEGEALRGWTDLDLESWWTDWPGVADLTLEHGRDYDRLVYAMSIGSVPHVCQELMAEREDWRGMVAGIPALMSQAMQLWLTKSSTDMGWTLQPVDPNDIIITATYVNPHSGHAEFIDLIPYEAWPADATPKSLWYFCGLMHEYEAQPPFTDHGYPARMRARVKHQCIQYLQASVGALMPGASPDGASPPGDPFGFDFDLLVDLRDTPGEGIARFDAQFWRANIDPTERYVASPPGSTKHRLKAWGSGFDNLTLAGDWIYTGLNVGSVEGTVMSGKLASHALTGKPELSQIVGYL